MRRIKNMGSLETVVLSEGRAVSVKFDLIRELRAAEAVLDRKIDRASIILADGSTPDRLSRAFRLGRVIRHSMWSRFLAYARPLSEARSHIECERLVHQSNAEREISEAVKVLRKGKPK